MGMDTNNKLAGLLSGRYDGTSYFCYAQGDERPSILETIDTLESRGLKSRIVDLHSLTNLDDVIAAIRNTVDVDLIHLTRGDKVRARDNTPDYRFQFNLRAAIDEGHKLNFEGLRVKQVWWLDYNTLSDVVKGGHASLRWEAYSRREHIVRVNSDLLMEGTAPKSRLPVPGVS